MAKNPQTPKAPSQDQEQRRRWAYVNVRIPELREELRKLTEERKGLATTRKAAKGGKAEG